MEIQRHLPAVFENSLDAILAEKLSRSEALLAETQQLAHIGSRNWDVSGDTVVWSDEHYRIFSLPPQSIPITYERFLQYVHPDDRPLVCAGSSTRRFGIVNPTNVFFASCMRTEPCAWCIPWHRPYSTTAATRCACSAPLRTLPNSARPRSESAKARSVCRLAVSAADLGVFEHDHRTEAVYWSKAAYDILGWSADEKVSLAKFIDAIHPEDRAEKVLAIRRAHDPAGEGLYSVEHRIVRRDGGIALDPRLFAHLLRG